MSFDNTSPDMEDELPALQQHPNILKTRDLTIFPDQDASQASTLPPRVAARFYRPSNNRRRSSATSSRRNSLSSSHSHHSNRPYRNLHHNHQVAQHLRRASIIEDRKARLADRAAHVEQVRLRAALAKAAPRCSNSEEKTQAAHQAREKHLAKVAAQCAEEVNRAKRIAEDMKEKKAVEEQRYRQEMEDRHAEAERRRMEVRRSPRKPRPASLCLLEPKKEHVKKALSDDAACIRIQKAWRRARGSQIVKTFVALEFSIDRVRELPFSEATDVLGDDRLISATNKFMDMLHLEGDLSCPVSSARRFLSAYMILGHPAEIFNKNGQQEQELMDKAKDMLIHFHAVIRDIQSHPSHTSASNQLEGLLLAYAAYVIAFTSWQSCDATVLIETMIDQFVAFDAIWQSVKNDSRGEVANDYHEGIREQQVLLLSKIKKLAGAERANTMIKKAIRESRRNRTQQPSLGDIRPRQLANTELSTEAVPSLSREAVLVGSSPIGDNSLPTIDGPGWNHVHRLFSVVPDNRVVVHELLIDPNYRVELSPESDIRSAFNRTLCDGMQQAILAGQGDAWTVAIAENIRAKLLRLLKSGNGMYQLIFDALDPEHVRSQCQQGIFSYGRFFAFMTDLLPRLCAPFRDEEVRRVTQLFRSSDDNVESMIQKLFEVLRLIDLMSLDYVNFMIQQAAPTLIQEARGYEHRMFAQDLEGGTISLQGTKSWLSNASVNLVTEIGYTDNRGRTSFERTHARGIVNLAIGSLKLQSNDVPETLQLDTVRLARIRLDTQRLITVGAILLTAKNILKRDVRTQWKADAKRIFDSIKFDDDNADSSLVAKIVATIESSHPMPQSSREQLSSFIGRFLTDSRRERLTDPVMKLLTQRLKLHLFNRLAASSSLERVRMASTASEGLAVIGLSEFIGQIGQIADELSKVSNIDRDAHSVWYRQIVDEVEESS